MNNNQNTILLSTAYFPPVEYFYYLQLFENALIETDETFAKQTYRNRADIYSEKGKMSLTVPVSKPFGNRTKTKEIQIFNENRWQINHWRAIHSAYQASPFFLYYKDDLEFFFQKEQKILFDFNLEITRKLCQLIGIKTNLVISNEFIEPGSLANDHRFDISPKQTSAKLIFPNYTQVFSDRHGFIQNLSILDLLFNIGPDTLSYLKKINTI